MKFTSSYAIKEQIKSLSERLKCFARNSDIHKNPLEAKIKSDNLQFNLSLIIAHIILKLDFIERSKNVFLKTIEEYNKTNKTTLTFEDFEKIKWIRIVADEAIIPEAIRSFIIRIWLNESKGKPVEIPQGKEHIIRCLLLYYERCFNNSKLTISKENLEIILAQYAPKDISLDFLTENEIMGFEPKLVLYYWKGNEYAKHLKNEIASTLWLLLGGEQAGEIEFKRFFKLIKGTQVWIDDLRSYLSHENTSRICEFAVEFLMAEEDLLKSDSEFNKIWLDANAYQHIQILDEVPSITLNYNNTYEFIESVDSVGMRFHDTFDYQGTRSYCFSLLRLVVNNDPIYPEPFQNTLKILKDTTRPFLVWTLYRQISKEYPEVIPYLLSDSELIPVALKQIDEITINTTLLTGQSNNEKVSEESYELKNKLWIEMFDMTLEQVAASKFQYKEIGEMLGRILINLAENLFAINTNNVHSIIKHKALLARYQDVLKKLSNKRIIPNIYPRPPINPRLVFSVLPDIIPSLSEKNFLQYLNLNGILNFNSGFVDLSVELLRLANLRFSKTEISEEQIDNINNVSLELVPLLEDYITEFYSTVELEVKAFNSNNIVKRRAQRGVHDFGFEIIDWGYLFLHFHKNDKLSTLNDNFKLTLDFKTESDKYDAQNIEQFEKIKLYLKSLMIGYYAINSKKNSYEIEGLPVTDTLKELESFIKYYSLTYSVDKLTKKRIDIFNERYNAFGNEMYYQPIISLLYSCINFFKEDSKVQFIENFFAESNDIGRMLTAMSILDSKELRNIVSKQIKKINIEDFIASSFNITKLQYALIGAVNSDTHWPLAKPLIERIQEHFERVKQRDDTTKNFLFEINLLLAFKEKDFTKLTDIQVPKIEFSYPNENIKGENTKLYYIALFKLYYDENYDDAIERLKSLLSKDSKNIRYAFQLYRAETMKAVKAQ